MKSKNDLLKRVKNVRLALERGLITTEEAVDLTGALEFMMRQGDVLDWGRYYFPDKFTLEFCKELHGHMVAIAQDPFTATLAPRGHAKTTIKCFLVPLFLALNHPENYRHFLNIQATATKSSAVNLSIRFEIENNELLIRDYGQQSNSTKWTERQFVLRNGVIFTAIGSGESVRGINYNNRRPDYVVADDLYDDDCIENPRNVEKINGWFWSSIYKCVANDRDVSIHVQGTAINRSDLLHTLAKNSRWKFRKFQAVDWESETVLWQEANTLEKLRQDKEDMGSIIFEREMQNNVRDDATAIIKESWIHDYDGEPILTKNQHDEMKRLDREIGEREYLTRRVAYVDPAAGTKEINDYTAKVACEITNWGNFYIIDAKNDRMTFDQNIRDMEAWHNRFKMDVIRFEAIGAFKGMVQEIRRRTNLPIEEISSVKDKITWLIAVSPKFENGKVFISKKIPENIRRELIEQLITNVPPHDDLRDAVVGCLEEKNTQFYFGIA